MALEVKPCGVPPVVPRSRLRILCQLNVLLRRGHDPASAAEKKEKKYPGNLEYRAFTVNSRPTMPTRPLFPMTALDFDI
jgi:hypothetical protein